MATNVLVNSHTPRRSSNAPQTTSSTKPSTSGVQPQNTPDTRLILDDTVERILDKAKSPLGEGEAQKVVETLEKMLDPRWPISLRMRRRCFRGLVKICGEYGILPSSYTIPHSKIRRLGDAPISSGGFSDVWPGAYKENEDEEDDEDDDKTKFVAIKVIRYCESDDVQAIKKNFCREVITWRRLSHSNILGLIGVMVDAKEYSMVSLWMDNGNIVEYLRENLQANPLKLLEDAGRGLQYLHSVDLAHGDLKGGNILVSDDGRACLADIGLTRVAGDLNSASAISHTSTTNGASTVRWCPPELLDPERFGSKRGSGPTKKSDIYSMAMTIYEVLTDRLPFFEYTDLVAMLHIIRGTRPKKPIFAITRGYTQELWDLTVSCWDVDPSKRPVVDEVLDALRCGGEQWRPKHGGLSTLPPRDDWSPTASEEEPDTPTVSEPESEPVANTSPSIDSLHPPVVETPVPGPTTSPPVPPHSTATPRQTPVTPKDELIRPAPDKPPKEEELRPTSTIRKKEETEHAPINASKAQLKPIPAVQTRSEVGSDQTRTHPPAKGEA